MLIIACLMGLATAQSLRAAEVSDLYTAQVAWEPGTRRDGAYRAALRAVLVKATGARSSLGTADVSDLLSRASALVLGYREGPNDTLWVSFDGRALMAELDGLGLPIWEADRPLTLVWLAVDKGRGDREILSASEPSVDSVTARRADPTDFFRERLRKIASERGLPIAFPLMDAEDQQLVSVADVQGGFTDQILQASQRYRATSILIGRASTRQADRIEWRWVFGTDQSQFRGSVETAGHRVADRMAELFAISGGTNEESLSLLVSGVRTVADYGRLNQRLESLPQVRSHQLQTVANGELEYRLTVIGGIERFREALGRDNAIEPVEMLSAPGANLALAGSLPVIRVRLAN